VIIRAFQKLFGFGKRQKSQEEIIQGIRDEYEEQARKKAQARDDALLQASAMSDAVKTAEAKGIVDMATFITHMNDKKKRSVIKDDALLYEQATLLCEERGLPAPARPNWPGGEVPEE